MKVCREALLHQVGLDSDSVFLLEKKLPPSSSILRPEQGGRNEGAKKVT